MIFGSDRKKATTEFCHLGKEGYVWKESGVTTQGRREVEVGTLLLGNGKGNVTAYEVLIYFQCLSYKFEVFVPHFRT